MCGRVGKPVRQDLCEAVQQGTCEDGTNTCMVQTELKHSLEHTITDTHHTINFYG